MATFQQIVFNDVKAGDFRLDTPLIDDITEAVKTWLNQKRKEIEAGKHHCDLAGPCPICTWMNEEQEIQIKFIDSLLADLARGGR